MPFLPPNQQRQSTEGRNFGSYTCNVPGMLRRDISRRFFNYYTANFTIFTFVFVCHEYFWRGCFAPSWLVPPGATAFPLRTR